MIQELTSRYRPRYLRSLVYMLQASEYDIVHFLEWYNRTADFAHVEKRKQLRMTRKAKLLLGAAWALVALAFAVVIAGLLMQSAVSRIVVLLLALTFPFVLPYLLAGASFLIQLTQRPIERIVIRRAADKLAKHPAVRIGIAGSYGKTSMREILRTTLAESKKVAAPGGSLNTPLGIAQFVDTLKGDEDVLIFEFGEYFEGDVRELCELTKPTIGVITGVNEAHLSKFGTLERTAKTIFELAEYLGERPVYVNAENAAARAHARPQDILFSREECNEWKVTHASSTLEGTSFSLQRGHTVIGVHSDILGVHMIGPMAAAADIATGLGLSSREIRDGLSKTTPFEHRMQKRDDAGVTLLDDSYNGNPDGVRAVIEFFRGVPAARRWYVTPGLVEMGRRSAEVHREIGRELAEAGIEKVVLVRNSATPFIEEGLKSAAYRGEVLWFDDGPSAYAALPHLTVKGDVVLLQNDWPDQYA